MDSPDPQFASPRIDSSPSQIYIAGDDSFERRLKKQIDTGSSVVQPA